MSGKCREERTVISCRAVANILAADQLAGASGWKRVEVWLHLAMCRHCTRFAQQLASIRRIARGLVRESQYGPVPIDLEERVLDRLTREL